MPRYSSRRQRGGLSGEKLAAVLADKQGDLNRFYTHFMKKALNADNVIVPAPVKSAGVTNSIMVIDMQNDFAKRYPDGAFSVTDGINTSKKIAEWVVKSAPACTKVVFTRDSHPENHCSFKTQGSIYPNHCVIDTPGAAMCESMMTKFSELGAQPLLDSSKVEVVFKGTHADTDSYGAVPYPEDGDAAGRQPPFGRCKWSNTTTGGFYLKKGDGVCLTNQEALGPNPFKIAGVAAEALVGNDAGWAANKKIFGIQNLFPGQTSGEHNVFVVGLAGDFCVRDTAINIAKVASKGLVNGVKVNVYVVNSLTRYVFLPLADGIELPPANIKLQADKDLTKYVFTNKNPDGSKGSTPRILSASEADAIADTQGYDYFRFTNDPVKLINDYNTVGVKILLDHENVNLASQGGGRRQSQRQQRQQRQSQRQNRQQRQSQRQNRQQRQSQRQNRQQRQSQRQNRQQRQSRNQRQNR